MRIPLAKSLCVSAAAVALLSTTAWAAGPARKPIVHKLGHRKVNHKINRRMDYKINRRLSSERSLHTVVMNRFEPVPFQTVRQPTDRLYIGQQRVVTYGVKGSVLVLQRDYFVNGRKVRQSVERRVVKQPINTLVEYGTKHRNPESTTLSSRSSTPSVVSLKQITVVATAYVAGGITATGCAAEPGVIAVDPSVIALGTKLYIPGIGMVRAADTGGAIVGDRIDICMASESAALNWGVRTITIYVVQ